jgi:hypothetical protein
LKKLGKSLVRINFHWPWATGPLLKSMTDIRYSIAIKLHSCYSILLYSISLYIFSRYLIMMYVHCGFFILLFRCLLRNYVCLHVHVTSFWLAILKNENTSTIQIYRDNVIKQCYSCNIFVLLRKSCFPLFLPWHFIIFCRNMQCRQMHI